MRLDCPPTVRVQLRLTVQVAGQRTTKKFRERPTRGESTGIYGGQWRIGVARLQENAPPKDPIVGL